MDLAQDKSLKILIAEDNKLDQILIQRYLQKSDLNHTALVVETREDFLAALESFKPTLILSDYSMPGFGALAALDILNKENLKIPLIIVTGTLSDEMAVECLKKGAVDYVIKDKLVRLVPAVKIAMEFLKSQERLRQTENQLQTITNILPAALCYITPDLKLSFANRISKEWFKENLIGMSVESIFGPTIATHIKENAQFLYRRETVTFESNLQRPAPPHVSFSLNAEIESGYLHGYVCLITDITDSKIYESQLKQAKHDAEAASHAKTQFLANMSHEMRTPLNAIMGLSELLQTSRKGEQERSLWLKKITRNTEHLKSVIDEILDLSKIEAGKLHLKISNFSLAQSIAQVRSILSPLASEKQIDLRFEIEGAIPANIDSDATKVQHILLNLLGNAIKFTSVGSVILKIKFEDHGTAPYLEFSVTDTGIGMSEEEAKHLFEPFTQVDSSMTRKFGGTGLGLTLARQLARALGGDVYLAKSVPQKGSTFVAKIKTGAISKSNMVTTFTDFLTDPAEETTDIALASENGHSESKLVGFKVLLIEDSLDNQLLVQNFLEMQGVTVELASDGAEGFNKAINGDHDLVIMDIQMPVMDGYTATTKLRQQDYEKPIIAFTAHAFEEERERCLRIGFTDFISKPIKKRDLIECVTKYYNQKPETDYRSVSGHNQTYIQDDL